MSRDRASARTRALRSLAVLAVTALGLALRWTGLDYDLPHANEPDPYILLQTEQLRDVAPDARSDPSGGRYPWLLASLNAAIPGGQLRPPPSAQAHSLQAQLAAAAGPHVKARRLFALLAALAIPACYLLARQFLRTGWSLLAAAFLATCLFHLSFSQQVRPHAALTSFSLLGVLGSLWLAQRGSLASFVGAGVSNGLAVACLHSGVFVIPPLLVACGVQLRARGWRSLPLCALPFVLIAGLAWWSYAAQPAVAPTPPAVPAGADIAVSGHNVHLERFNGRGFRVLAGTLGSHDPSLLVLGCVGALGLLGALVAARRRSQPPAALRRDAPGLRVSLLIVLAFVGPSLLVFGSYQASMGRYFLPTLPFLALLASGGVATLVALGARVLRRPAPRGLALGASLLALALPLAVCIRLVQLRSAPDTATLAARWIEEHLERWSDTVFVGPLDSLPLLQAPGTLSPDSVWSRSSWERYQCKARPAAALQLGYRLRYLTSEERAALLQDPGRTAQVVASWPADYAVITPLPERAPRITWRAHELTRSLERVIRARGTLLARIDPYAGATPGHELGHDLGPDAVRDLCSARSLGPTIEIYRLGP